MRQRFSRLDGELRIRAPMVIAGNIHLDVKLDGLRSLMRERERLGPVAAHEIRVARLAGHNGGILPGAAGPHRGTHPPEVVHFAEPDSGLAIGGEIEIVPGLAGRMRGDGCGENPCTSLTPDQWSWCPCVSRM